MFFIIFNRVRKVPEGPRDANRCRGYNCLPKGGSYTWSNQRLLIDSALVKMCQNPTLFLPLSGSNQNSWHPNQY